MQLCWMFHVAPFAHPVARCWELLHSFAQHYNKDASTRNVVGATMLDVIVSVSKELNFVIYIEVIYDKKNCLIPHSHPRGSHLQSQSGVVSCQLMVLNSGY